MASNKMAQLVRVTKDGIEIDLQPLGYYLATDPVEVTRLEDGLCKVRFSLIAEHVIVDPPVNNSSSNFDVVVTEKPGVA